MIVKFLLGGICVAVKQFRPAKTKFKVKYKKTYLCAFIAFVVVTAVCFGLRISNNKAIAGYEKQIAEVQQKVDTLNEENNEYISVLNSSDRSEYYEKIAREVYGYGKPGEYVFYKAES